MTRTPWFPGTVKPVRVGLYEVEDCGWVYLDYFDGEYWRDVETGYRWNYQNFEWRGLTEEAK